MYGLVYYITTSARINIRSINIPVSFTLFARIISVLYLSLCYPVSYLFLRMHVTCLSLCLPVSALSLFSMYHICPSVWLCHICLSVCLYHYVPPICLYHACLFVCVIISVPLFACRMDHTNRPSSVSCYSGRCHVLVPITLLDYSPEFRSFTIVIFRFIDRDSSRSILLSANMMSRKDGLYVVILSIWMPTWRSSYMLRMWASDSATPVWRAMAGGRIPLSWKGPESIWTWVSNCLGTFLAPSWRSLLEKAVRARSEKNFTLSSES